MPDTLKKSETPILITKPIFVDLAALQSELEDVWKFGWLTNNGCKHQQLEKLLTEKILRVPAVSLVTNATVGLLGILKSFELEGEVITTPFTFPATPHAITWAGLKPVFCDIDPDTLNIDPKQIEKHITKNTRAILGVHVFGNPCDVETIDQIAKKHHLKVIYDAAHAFELELKGKSIATYGDASVFSFHATKLFHTAEGGAITFTNLAEKKKFDILKNFGIENEEIVSCGLNFKMSELQAAMGMAVFDVKDRERENRARVKKIYMTELANVPGIILPCTNPIVSKESLQYFAIRISAKDFGASRDSLWKALKEHNIFTRRYFYPLCTEYPHYKQEGQRQKYPISYQIIDEVLCLPLHGELSNEEVFFICEAIKSYGKCP